MLVAVLFPLASESSGLHYVSGETVSPREGPRLMSKHSEPTKPTEKSVKARTGSATTSGEEPVSSKETPSPAPIKSGNTPETRPPAQARGTAPPSAKSGAKPGDHTEATGRDHPSQSEHAKALGQKLHGTSEQRTKGGAPD